MNAPTSAVAKDIAAIGRIAAVPTILHAMASLTGMRFAAVARVTDTTWTACAVRDQINFGLAPGGELVLETTICNEIRQHRKAVIFGQASAHPHFSTHHTPLQYGLESYVSIPIILSDGSFFGTLCAIDPEPANLDDPMLLQTLDLFAQLIGSQLDLEDRLSASEAALLTERDNATLREQFIAVLGHDLRSPLQSIRMAAYGIGKLPLPDMAKPALQMILRGGDRMAELIRNVLDFARGRLGGGIPTVLREEANLADALAHVVAEQQAVQGNRFLVDFAIDSPVVCDRDRLAQLLTNLLANAVTHGEPDATVGVEARIDGNEFVLAVENRGSPIPDETRARLFQPFYRGAANATPQGLGLGLYIASEIAKAHRGGIEVSSDADRTRFALRMPRATGL